jgi:hypothetical protein
MNKLKKILSFILVACFGFSVNAQNATATADIGATATIITPISVAGTALAFGNFATSGVGTVVLATDNSLSSTLLAKHMQDNGTAGTITVEGEKDELFSLAISQKGDFNIAGASGDANTLALSDFTSSEGSASSGNFINITIPTGGSITMNIGATLTTTATQNAGAYVGEITVLVSYE